MPTSMPFFAIALPLFLGASAWSCDPTHPSCKTEVEVDTMMLQARPFAHGAGGDQAAAAPASQGATELVQLHVGERSNMDVEAGNSSDLRVGATSCIPMDEWYPFAGGNCRNAFSSGDFDDDGDLDIMVAARNYASWTPGPYYYENKGHAKDPRWEVVGPGCTSWARSSNPPGQPSGCRAAGGQDSPLHDFFPSNEDEMRVECADFDADGDLDCVFGHYGTYLTYVRNDGSPSAPSFTKVSAADGPFTASLSQSISSHVSSGCWSPQCHDWDADGDVDCWVWACHNGKGVYLENIGTPSAPAFQIDTSSALSAVQTSNYGTAAKGDIDGDGDVDLFTGSGGDIFFIENTGTASVPAWEVHPISKNDPATPLTGISTIISTASSFTAPHFLDWDGDGDLDLLVGSDWCDVVLVENTGTRTQPVWALLANSRQGDACTGSLSPTPQPAPATPTAFGDPHIKNVRGEAFEVRRAGEHTMLSVPQGADIGNTSLRLDALMEPEAGNCSAIYIRRLVFSGRWLGDTPSLTFLAEGSSPSDAAVLKVGNSSALTVAQFASLVSATMVKFTLPDKNAPVPVEANRHATSMAAVLKLGPGVSVKVSWASERTPSQSIARSLWVSVAGLSSVRDPVGGLLGHDDHDIVSAPDPGCTRRDV